MARAPKTFLLLVFVFTLFIPDVALSQNSSWTGKVVGVTDGDTITVMHQGRGERIRLYGIDCPEKGQAFGTKAKRFTSDMTFGKEVDVQPLTTDRYGRTIAWVHINGHCVNEELLRAGLAWHYKRYSSDEHLAELERHRCQAYTIDKLSSEIILSIFFFSFLSSLICNATRRLA